MHSRSSDPEQEPAGEPTGADPLAAVIELLRPQAVLSKIVSGAGSWSIRYDAHLHPGFCLMLDGSCFLDVRNVGTFELHAGDFLFLPVTHAFSMSSDPKLTPKLVEPTQVEELRHGSKDGPPTMRQLGGYFRFDRTNAQLLVKFLPPSILIRRDEPGASRIHRVVELIAEETKDARPGKDLILARLVEVLMVEALRFRPASSSESNANSNASASANANAKQEQGLLAGLADAGLARALRQLHEDVAHKWTVDELAKVAGMSRAVFAERFMRKVGLPPMQYLLEWRIAIAKDALRRDRTPLAEVAEKIGYQSASAFSTAFTRHAGIPPSEFARANTNANASQ